jgi:cobalamin biosynthesis Mg chelatase CobN
MLTTTGVNITVSGSSLQDGTQLTAASTDYGDKQPSGTSAVSVSGAVFYDINVTSTSGALSTGVSVTVSISDPSFTSASVIEYWNGNSWVSVATTFTAPDTVSGIIPASALTGTPIVVGIPKASTVESTLSATSLSIIIAIVVVVVVILGLLFVYVRKRKSKKTTPKSTPTDSVEEQRRGN